MSEPRITERAQSDLDEAWAYLAERNEAAADRLIDGVLQKARLHAELPLMGRPRNDLRPGLRSFVVHPYTIFYRPAGDTIEVVRVLHGRRDIETLMKDPDSE